MLHDVTWSVLWNCSNFIQKSGDVSAIVLECTVLPTVWQERHLIVSCSFIRFYHISLFCCLYQHVARKDSLGPDVSSRQRQALPDRAAHLWSQG